MSDLSSSKRKSLANAAVTTAAVAAGLLLLNVAFEGVRARADLSESNAFSVTPASARLVAGLDEPLRITAYFGNVPEQNQFHQQVVEAVLERYADASDGMLSWEQVNPLERDRAFQQQLREDEGIDKMMWVSMVDDTPQQVPVYFQIKFEYLDQEEVWTPPPQFSHEALERLEYDFSSIIKRLAYPRKKVAVTTGFGSPPQAQAIRGILSQTYEVELVDVSAAEADLSGYDVLIVNGPAQPLSQAALMLIDQHVLAGKPTLFLLRGMRSQSGGSPGAPGTQPALLSPVDDGLAPLLAHYGIDVARGVVMDARANTTGGVVSGAELLLARELFPLAEVLANGDTDPLAGIDLLPLPFATRVEPAATPPADVELRPLLRSSPYAWWRDELLPIVVDSRLEPQPGAERGPFTTALALDGAFTSYIAAGAGDAPRSPAHTRIIALGSAELVSDQTLGMAGRYQVFRALGAGASALPTMVDWLAEDLALVAARAKAIPPRIDPLDADARRWIKYGNSGGTAVLLLLIGAVAWAVRERRRRSLSL